MFIIERNEVRTMAYEALKVIRPFVKVSSRIAPRFMGNLAFKAFCRPPRASGTDDTQRRLMARAEARMDHAERIRVSYEGGEVQAYRFRTQAGASKGTVLLIHGWTGRAAFMSAFVEPLNASGFDVLGVDLPGHGHSSGRILHVPLGIKALHAVHAQLGPWHGVIGHSFGGAIAASLLSGAVAHFPAIPVNRLVLIATPHSIPQLFQWFGQTVGLSRRSQHWFAANVKRLAGRDLSTFEGDALLRQAGMPTLLLHAPDDKEVSFASAEVLATSGDHVSLVPMPGLGHRRILYATATVEAARAFMATD
jgi:pimeloyl-ACP methyl ester carboxylesterase